MTLDRFWSLVEGVHVASGGDMDRKCELLEAELRRLPLDEVRSFHAHFYECQDRAYNWELWAAAYIIGGGCSDVMRNGICDWYLATDEYDRPPTPDDIAALLQRVNSTQTIGDFVFQEAPR